MVEKYPAGAGHQGDPGDQVGQSPALTPEAAELIGDEALGNIDRATYALTELERLGSMEDPFAHDRRPSQVDLGFLKPELAELVLNYHSTSRPFKGMTGREIASFGRRMAMRIRGIHKVVRQGVEDAEPLIQEAGQDIGQVADPSPDNFRVSLLPELQHLMGKLVDVRDKSPSKATFLVVENAYAATVSSRSHATGLMEHRGLSFIPGKMGEFTDSIRERQTQFKKVANAGNIFRGAGSQLFKAMNKLIAIERIKEAASLLDVVDAAKQRLPEGDGLEGGQLDAAITAEEYLTEPAKLAASILKESDPSFLRDPQIGPIVRRLLQPALSRNQESGQPEQQVTIGNDVICRLTEAKNILRGGRRLKPDNGQGEDDIKRTADELHALKDGQGDQLLDPEESGLIVAIVTEKFEGFAHVFKTVKHQAGNGGLSAFPAERASVVRELDRFDLNEALVKIGALLDDPDSRLFLERILGVEKTHRVQAVLNQAQETEPTVESAE